MNVTAKTDLQKALSQEAKRLIIDATYTGRGHQTAGLRMSKWNTWLGVPTTIATALLSSAAGLTALIGNHNGWTAFLALLSASLISVRAFLRPDKLADEHGLKGDRMIGLRNQARLFLNLDLRADLSEEELAKRLHRLRDRYDELNETLPRQIPRKDYEAARKSIEAGESNYENDPLWKELDPDGSDS